MTMADTNISLVLHKINDLQLEERPIPEPSPDEVQLCMHSVGICGSDVHYLTHGRIGDFIVKQPMVMGHESSAVVSKCGKNVTNLAVGDRVAIEPGVPCRTCNYCKIGRYNLCADMKFAATPPFDGTLARYVCYPADFCFKIPPEMSMEEAAMCEPLSVAVHACNRAKIGVQDTVFVSGGGPIGLLNLMTALAYGARGVVVSDIDGKRLERAKSLGATATILIEKSDTAEGIAEKVKSSLGGDPASKSIECSGSPLAVKAAIFATSSGGTMVAVGMGPAEIEMPYVEALWREVDIRGVFRYANCYPTAISLISSGKVNVKSLITHRFKLEESVKAFETARDQIGDPVKIMIKCARE